MDSHVCGTGRDAVPHELREAWLCSWRRGNLHKRTELMSFTARVKDGKIFEATEELDENGIRTFDAQTLEPGKIYGGYLYNTTPTSEPNTFRYKDRARATYRSNELELLPLPVMLKKERRRLRGKVLLTYPRSRT
jgi:hypothetical protein